MRSAVVASTLYLVLSPALGLPFVPIMVSELAKREATMGPDEVPAFQHSDPRAEGGLIPGMPGLPGGGGGGSEPGMMFNQPMAMMGGFTMLMMPAQDAMAMANSFTQFMGSMPQMPSLPSMPG